MTLIEAQRAIRDGMTKEEAFLVVERVFFSVQTNVESSVGMIAALETIRSALDIKMEELSNGD